MLIVITQILVTFPLIFVSRQPDLVLLFGIMKVVILIIAAPLLAFADVALQTLVIPVIRI
jgi:hypothetical protein